MSKKECELPFWRDYSVILNHFTLQYTPQCEHSKWNFLFRLLLLSVFVGMIASVLGGLSAFLVTILFGTLTAFAIIMSTPTDGIKKWDTYHSLPYVANVDPSADPSAYIAPLREHFVNGGSRQGSAQPSGPTGFVEVDAFPYSGPALSNFFFISSIASSIQDGLESPPNPASIKQQMETIRTCSQIAFLV